mgnify:CR=1 FL=1
MNTVIFKLKMSAKRFMRESVKAEKEKEKNLKLAKARLMKGDEAGARLYAGNAQANIAQAQKYQAMGIRLDVMTGQLKSNSAFQSVMKEISRDAAPILMREAETMDLKDLMQNFEMFNEAFDKMQVGTAVMGNAMEKLNEPGTTQNTEDMMNQLRNEVAYEMHKDNEGMPMVNVNISKPEDTKDVDQFIEDLKK